MGNLLLKDFLAILTMSAWHTPGKSHPSSVNPSEVNCEMKSTKRAVKTNCLNSLCDAKYIMERNGMRQTFVVPIRSSFNRTKTPREINLCLMPFLSLLLKGDLNPTLRGKKPTKASRSLGERVDPLRAWAPSECSWPLQWRQRVSRRYLHSALAWNILCDVLLLDNFKGNAGRRTSQDGRFM